MTTIQDFVKRYPVVAFYVLAFAISWGGVLMIIGGPGAIPGTTEQTGTLVGLVMLAWFAGPSITSILLTALLDGKAGLRELLSRLLRWRVGIRWYVVALVAGPLVYMAGLLPLALFSHQFLPGILTTSDKASLLLFGIGSGLIGGGFLEELGWTGFGVPRLRLRYSALTTGLIVGVLWGAVHFSVVFWLSGSNIGGLPLALFVIVRAVDLLIGQLPAFRVLMVWVYDRTGSLLVAMLMHASLSASMLILAPETVAGVPFLIYCVVSSAAAWVIVVAVAAANRGKLEARRNLKETPSQSAANRASTF